MKIFKLTAVTLALGMASPSNAALVAYTDRALFESALASFTVDSFDGIAQNSNPSYVRNDFTFSTASGAGSFGCINHAGCGDNSVLGFDSAYLWNYGTRYASGNVFTFNAPVYGLGFDYTAPTGYPEATPTIEGVTATLNTGFFGVISDVALSSFTLEQNVDFMLTDNITYGRQLSAVPVPAAVWLFGSGIAGLAAFARRRKSF